MNTLRDRITMDPAICHGKPTIRGLRYPVELILDLLSSGMNHDEILADYEDLEREDIRAVLEYAADVIRVKRVEPSRHELPRRCPATRRFAGWLRDQGHDALHTLDLTEQNRTSDGTIIDIAGQQDRVVITKDADFVDSYILRRQPEKLLLVATGNIGNRDLEQLVHANLATIIAALEQADFVEVNRTGVILRA